MLYVMPLDSKTHEQLGLHLPAPASVNGRSNADALQGLNHPDDQIYTPCAEALADAPRGRYHKFSAWQESECYPGTERTFGVYVPANAGTTDLPLLICNDGAAYASPNGPVRVTRVLDALIDTGEIDPVVGVFVNPADPLDTQPDTPNLEYDAQQNQRSLEYDALTPLYGRFLVAVLLPWIEAELDLKFTDDPRRRTVCGISSGGIAAFSCAWFHPHAFQRVISHCGSFTNIRGGHNYPYLVHTTPAKPVRVYMQSGRNDITTLFGHWPTANMAMAEALKYAGYDVHFEFGQGGHTLRHAGALFADTMRWLWRD